MTLAELLASLYADDRLKHYVNDVRSRFQIGARQYVGATILPPRPTDNMFREDGFEFLTPIAADGTRLSPVPMRGGRARAEGMLVELGSNDMGAQFDGRDYEAVRRHLNAGDTIAAQLAVLNWLTNSVLRPLSDLEEKQRWQAILDAEVIRQGENGYREIVGYENPAGHRVDAGQLFYDPTVDPFETIGAIVQLMEDAGFPPTAGYTFGPLLRKLANHPKVKQAIASGTIILDGGTGNITSQTSGRVTIAMLNDALQADFGFTVRTYSEQYMTPDGALVPFLRRDALAITSTTTVDPLDVGEASILEPTTLGYHAVGSPIGHGQGRAVFLRQHQDQKNPRVEAEATQMTLPVIRRPEGVGVLTVPDEA